MGLRRLWPHCVRVCAKQKMALANVLASVGCIDFALASLTQIVLLKLAFRTTLVVDRGAAEVIMRHTVAHDSILLGEHLRLVNGLQRVAVGLFSKECVVLVGGRSVVNRAVKAHSEVGDSHSASITNFGLLLQLQLFWRVSLRRRCFVLKLGRPVCLADAEVGVARLLLQGLVLLVRFGHCGWVQRVQLAAHILVLRRRL